MELVAALVFFTCSVQSQVQEFHEDRKTRKSFSKQSELKVVLDTEEGYLDVNGEKFSAEIEFPVVKVREGQFMASGMMGDSFSLDLDLTDGRFEGSRRRVGQFPHVITTQKGNCVIDKVEKKVSD